MAKKPNERHLTFCVDGVVRDQFQQLCRTLDVSAGSVMRQWIETALEQGTIELNSGPQSSSNSFSSSDKKLIQNILSRLDEVERNTAYLNENQMEFIKDEVLGDSMGTLRNRIGVVEKEILEIGGNISKE